MSIVHLLLSSLLLGLALAIKPSIIHERTTKMVESSKKPETPTSSTSELPEVVKFAESSIVPIKSRILERTTYLKPARNLFDPNNSTLFVTVANDDEKNISTTTRRPLSLGDFATSSRNLNFKPSIHLGEINESELRKSSNENNPFNKVSHLKFVNAVRINDEERFNTDRVKAPAASSFRDDERASIVAQRKKIPGKFFETDSRYGIAVPVEIVHQQQEYFEPHQVQQVTEQEIDNDNNYNGDNNSDNDDNSNDNEHQNNQQIPMGHDALVTFDYPRSPAYITVTSRPMTLGRPVYPSTIMSDIQPMHHPQHYYVPMIHDNAQTIHVKPSKYHDEIVTAPPNTAHIQHYEYASPASGEAIEKPEVQNYHENYHQGGNYQHLSSHENEMQNIGKPDSVLYLTSHRETAFTRMRKFPYKFYEPSILGHQDEYHYLQEGQHGFPSKERRVSPWKKIIHLIGAFLPLGLLLATLKPNIVKIENTTQPNIVLSKLRVVDLPAEHKRGRLVDEYQDEYEYQQDTCDDRSICELIVSGSEPSSNLLQNILWNLTNKSTDAEAQKHGLHEIFAAAKRKDCSTIDC